MRARRTTTVLAAGLVAVAVGLVGCGATPASPPSAPPGSGSGGPGGPGASAQPGPRVASATVSSDGRTLTLTTYAGVCDDYAASATETSAAVTVRITATPKRSGNVVCAAMAQQVDLDVPLAAPLGSRPVVDAADGRTVPVT